VQEPSALACPFCGTPLAVVQRDLGEAQDTGGRGTLTEFRCNGCGAVMTHFVHDKVMRRSDQWQLDESRVTFPIAPQCPGSELPVYVCVSPRCEGDLVAAVPRGAVPDDVPPETALSRTIAFACMRCGARYLRLESGTWAAGTVTGWNVLERAEASAGTHLLRYVPVSAPQVRFP
jgi:uncharacterized protein with PIN domain